MKPTIWADIRQTLYNYFDHQLLENGAYVTITTGQKNVQNNDLSLLYPVVDNTLPYPSGHIWQSAFHNWNYESGVLNNPSPIVASGVYVNGVFTPRSTTMHMDYRNGRVIFDTAISTSSVVQANFSYKEYSFVRPNNNSPFKNLTKYQINSKIDSNPFAATPDIIHLPAIFIEIDYGDEAAFQFGGTHKTLPNFKFSIVSNDESQVEEIASLLCGTATKATKLISALNGPKFDGWNDLTENYSFYDWYANGGSNFLYLESVKYNRFYEAKAESLEPSLFGGVINVEILAIR